MQSDSASLPVVLLVFPDGHAVHAESEVAAVDTEYLPAAHATQVLAEAAPTVGEYLPRAQALQVPPLLPWYPALHVHADEEEDAGGDVECVGQGAHAPADVAATSEEYVPCTQSEHADGPTESLYCPEGQLEHAPPFGPLKPWLHRHASRDPLPASALESPGHASHADGAVLPVEAELIHTLGSKKLARYTTPPRADGGITYVLFNA